MGSEAGAERRLLTFSLLKGLQLCFNVNKTSLQSQVASHIVSAYHRNSLKLHLANSEVSLSSFQAIPLQLNDTRASSGSKGSLGQ